MELDLESLTSAARKDETFFSHIFLEFRKHQDFDSVAGLLCHVLEKTRIAQHFELPAQPQLVSAYVEILTSPSLVTAPLLRVMTNRFHLYFSTIPEVLTHPMASRELSNASAYLGSLLGLLRKYGPKTERTSLATIAHALQSDSIHEYQDEWNDTALRVVLRTLYATPREHTSRAKDDLLAFVIKQLKGEIARSGHIPEPRHAWWAIVTLLSRAQARWLGERRRTLARAIAHLMDLSEYSVREGVAKKSIAPELKTREMENIWIGINASRILRSDFASHLSANLLRKLRDCLTTRLHTTSELIVQNSFKVRSVHLLFTYELLRLQAMEQGKSCCRWKNLNMKQRQLAASYWSKPVLTQVARLSENVATFLNTPSKWTKHTLTSTFLCGLPGQGKSELIRELGLHFDSLCQMHGRKLFERVYAIGREVNDQQDLKTIMESYHIESTRNAQSVFLIVFDEVDKAQSFNFYTPFLSVLEEKCDPAKKALTLWVFAQSSYPTLAVAKEYAHGLPNKSMRDFLTRMQWGELQLPELRFSPDQRLMAALGCTLRNHGTLVGFTGRWGAHFASAYHLNNIRDLMKELAVATVVDRRSFVDVSVNRRDKAAAAWLDSLPGRGENRVTLVM